MISWTEMLASYFLLKKNSEAVVIKSQIRPLVKEAVAKKSIFFKSTYEELSKFADKNSKYSTNKYCWSVPAFNQ